MKTALKAFEQELNAIREAGTWREERIITTPQRSCIDTTQKSHVVNMCANNYLGLSDDPRLIEAAKASYDRWGFGLSSVRFICGTQEIHKELEERCDVFFELDTYWSFVAKRDPVSEMERLKSRLRCIHLKDGSPDGKGCSLGQGAAPVKAVRKKAIELGVGIVVESEGLDPTGKEEVERCINFLKACDAEDAE